MREIKFRAWIFPYETILCRKIKGEMINELLEYNNNEISYRSGLSVVRLTQYEHKFELMQYTGLKDKNGKEIYEGDVLRIAMEGIWQGKPEVVAWDDYGWLPFIAGIGDRYFFVTECQVIGNIYESPEFRVYSRTREATEGGIDEIKPNKSTRQTILRSNQAKG